VLILLAARLLFGVAIRGPVADLFAATVIYLVGGLGLGLLVSTLADSQSQAFQIGATISILPSILLSGFIFPIRNMPDILQSITYLVPARYYLVILRGVILKGAGLGPYPTEILILCFYAVLVLLVAGVRMARRET
jgi:ABC-2 type transport system permease protein